MVEREELPATFRYIIALAVIANGFLTILYEKFIVSALTKCSTKKKKQKYLTLHEIKSIGEHDSTN